MANRNIDTELWNDPKLTDDFTAEDKYFWLFLLTTKYGNLSGCFEITHKQIARDMGYSEDTARNLIYRFTQIHKVITYDDETKELLIHNWYKYNWSKSPKLEPIIMKFINQIKSENLRLTVEQMYDDFKNGDTVSIGYRYPTNTIFDFNKDLELKEKIKPNRSSNKNFQKPSVEEVVEYCKEKKNGIDGEAFWHFYESKGWKIGKEPMKSWKSAMVTWEKKRKEIKVNDKNTSKKQLEELQEIVRNKQSKMFGGIK